MFYKQNKEECIMTYEQYKRRMIEIIEKRYDCKSNEEDAELQKLQDELEMRYPEFDEIYRQWIFEELEKNF